MLSFNQFKDTYFGEQDVFVAYQNYAEHERGLSFNRDPEHASKMTNDSQMRDEESAREAIRATQLRDEAENPVLKPATPEGPRGLLSRMQEGSLSTGGGENRG